MENWSLKNWYQCWIFKIKNIFPLWIYTYFILLEWWDSADYCRVWINSFGKKFVELWWYKHNWCVYCLCVMETHYTQKLTFKIWYQCCNFRIKNISSSSIWTCYTSIWRWRSVVYCHICIKPFGLIFTELSRVKDSSTFEKKWTLAIFL